MVVVLIWQVWPLICVLQSEQQVVLSLWLLYIRQKEDSFVAHIKHSEKKMSQYCNA